MKFASMTVPPPPAGPLDWNEEGVVLLPNFMPSNLMDEYEACWLANNSERPGG
jgi:hypothetical protein